MTISNNSAPELLLVKDHDELDQLLNTLLASDTFFEQESAFDALDLFWARLAMHIRAEHHHLFPVIVDSFKHSEKANEIDRAIFRLKEDHDFFMKKLAEAVNLLRQLKQSGSDLREASQTVHTLLLDLKARLESHNSVEEEFIYKMPLAVMTSDQLTQLAENIRREITNIPSRFTAGRNDG